MKSARYRCGAFKVDSDDRRFSQDDIEIILEAKVFAVILQLLDRPAALVTRDELLDTVWGHRFVTPSTLNRVIALARRAFGDDANEPRYIETVHGAGYRYIGPVEPLSLEATELKARFGPPSNARLPARVQTLIGRERELGQIRSLLDEHRGVTVLGTGGMGKTQCALEFGRQHAAAYPDGVWFFDLAALHDAHEWLRALALALFVQPAEEAELLASLPPLLAGRRALLLLDNCDRIAPAVGSLVLTLLRSTDELKVLSTSQQPLGFLGEQLLRIPPLALPELREELAGERGLAHIAGAPAVALLCERACEVQPGFDLTPANSATVVEICTRLDGMPLAIELAAARFAVLSAGQVLERLEQRFRFLDSDLSGRDPRHRNLLALLEWSYQLLSVAERRLLHWLAVFMRGWMVEGAIDVAGVLGHDPPLAVDLLGGLVKKSLVSVNTSLAPPRYVLLETVREFALQRLAESGEERLARDAHLAYVRHLALSIDADIHSGQVRERLPQLMHEDANIRSAIGYASSFVEGRLPAMAIAGSLMLYWRGRGNYHFALRLYEVALSNADGQQSPEHARAMLGYGVNLLFTTKTRRKVAPVLSSAADEARAFGDSWTEACAQAYLAMCFANAGEVDEAERAGNAAATLAAGLEDDLLLGLAGLARGWIHLARQDAPAAIEALRAARNLGPDPHQHHFIHTYLGLALFLMDRVEVAAAHLLNGAKPAVEYNNLRGSGGFIEACAYLLARLGRLEEAAQLLGAAMRIREQTDISLINFWIAPHERAVEVAQLGLGSEAYEFQIATGRAMRNEDAINLTIGIMQQISAGVAAD